VKRWQARRCIVHAVMTNDREGVIQADLFLQSLNECLAEGCFRLVFVLDDVPADLARLVGYLEAVTDGLTVDLISITPYDIDVRASSCPSGSSQTGFPHPSATSRVWRPFRRRCLSKGRRTSKTRSIRPTRRQANVDATPRLGS
jgi:hypothetical protein